MEADPAPVDPEDVSKPAAGRLALTASQKMALFEEQQRAFQDQYNLLTLSEGPPVSRARPTIPIRAGSSRSASMSPTREFTGLEGLNNLVRLMEHLTELRERNITLLQHCTSLQDTKSMLQDQLVGASLRRKPRARYASRARGQGRKKPRSVEPPTAASDGSDTGQGPSSASGYKHHRSHSVGSLDLADVSSLQAKAAQYEDKGPQRLAAKSKKRFSKWSKSVKKAFVGKMENIARRSSTVTIPPEMAAELKKRKGTLYHTKSADEGMLGLDADDLDEVSASHQDGNPPSPDSVKSEPPLDMLSDPEAADVEEEEEDGDQQPSLERRNSAQSDGALLPSPIQDRDDQASAHSDDEAERLRYMQARKGRRRQSSPSVSRTDLDELAGPDDDDLSGTSRLRRSASFKERRCTRRHDSSEEHHKTRKPHRFAWGKVKEMIHVRKSDSLKRKQRSNSEGTELAAPDEIRRSKSADADTRNSMDEGTATGTPVSTPQPQRKILKTQTDIQTDGGTSAEMTPKLSSSPLEEKALEIQALMGGLSEEYAKKMKDWEQKKSTRKSLSKDSTSMVSIDKQGANFSKEFIRKMEEWEKKMEEQKALDPMEDEPSEPGEAHSSRQEELEATLSLEFQKTVREWEKLKSKRQQEDTSPTFDLQVQQPRKEDRSRSREHDRDQEQSKHRPEKTKAEKDLHRVEKELHKIEQKEIKIEREKQKLIRMKEHLELSSPETSTGCEHRYESSTLESPRKSRGESRVQMRKNVTSFPDLKQFEEAPYLEKQHGGSKHSSVLSEKHSSTLSEGRYSSMTSSGKVSSMEGEHDTPPSTPSSTSKEESHPLPSSAMVDDSTSIDLSYTGMENTVSLQNQNNRLHQELAKKRQELVHLQDQVTSLGTKLDNAKRDHQQQIDHYKKELWASSRLGQEAQDRQEMDSYLGDLRSKLDHLHQCGDKLANERASLESQMMEQIKARDAMETKLMAEIKNLQVQMGTDVASKESSHKFHSEDGTEKLYDYILSLQLKLSDLKMGVVERNKLIGEMKRHLLVQEANNLMLEADMARRELELQYFKEARRSGAIKRWKTFTGMDAKYREALYGKYDKKREPSSPGLQKAFKEFEDCLEDLRYGGMQPLDLPWMVDIQQLGIDSEIQSLLAKMQAQKEKPATGKEAKKEQGVEVSCQTCDGLLESQRQSKAVQTDGENLLKAKLPRQLQHGRSGDDLSLGYVTGTDSFLQLPSGSVSRGSSGSLAEQSPKSPKDMEVSFTFTLPSGCLVSSRSSNLPAKPRMGISVDTLAGKQRRQWVPMVAESPGRESPKDSSHPEYTQSLDRPHKVRTRPRPEALRRQEAVSRDSLYSTDDGALAGSGSAVDAAGQTGSPLTRPQYPHTPWADPISRCLYSPPPSSTEDEESSTTCHPPVRASIFGRDNTKRFSGSKYIYHPPEVKADQQESPGPRRPIGFKKKDKDKEKVNVKHMINRFEAQSSLSDRGTPSPPIKAQLSPVQRLKTASELMQESGKVHRNSQGPSSNRSSVSGLHDDQRMSPTVSEMVRQWSGDSTPPLDSGRLSPGSNGANIQRLIKQLSRETTPDSDQHSQRRGSSSSNGKGEIIEKTLRKLSDAGLEIPDVPSGIVQPGSPKEHSNAFKQSIARAKKSNSPSKELPAEGFVSQRATQFETRIKSDTERSTAVIIPVQHASPSHPWEKGSKTESPKYNTEGRTRSRFRTGRTPRQSNIADDDSSSRSTERTRSFTSFFFPGKEGRSKKKEAKQAKHKGDAISTLCRQAMTVDMERQEGGLSRQWISTEGAIGEASSSPSIATPEKRRKGRFLDRDWLQKPKRLFRVSNTE